MKKTILAVLASAFMLTSFPVCAAVDAGKAESFVKKITKEGIEEIIDSNVSQSEKDKRFEKLFNEALDLKFIGQFVLGRYWRQASQSQKNEFIEVYRQLNVKTWSKRFDEFKGKDFIFEGTSPSTSANQVSSIPKYRWTRENRPPSSGASNKTAAASRSSTSSLKTSAWRSLPATNTRRSLKIRRPA